MRNYYQMTLADLTTVGPVKPTKEHETIKGSWKYTCPLCGELVAIEYDGTVHRELGFIYKRDTCRNGHDIDWSEE